jgi:hypothetical protein
LTPACPRIKLTGVAKLFARTVKLLTPKRRWAQFSLATMFVVVTVLCVGLALVVVPAERQRRAVAAIKALGGGVHYVEPDQGVSEAFPRPFLRRWLPRDYFDEVQAVHLDGSQVTDDGLEHLNELTRLESLSLGSTQVTDAGLTHLQRLTRFKNLWLNGTQVTDAVLAQLQGMTRLEYLNFDGTQVTDAGLAHLQGLTELQQLSLINTHVTDAGLAHLQGLTGLKNLWLNGTQVTDAGRAQLKQTLPKCHINPWSATILVPPGK